MVAIRTGRGLIKFAVKLRPLGRRYKADYLGVFCFSDFNLPQDLRELTPVEYLSLYWGLNEADKETYRQQQELADSVRIGSLAVC